LSAAETYRRYHDLDALRATAMLMGIGLHAMMSFITMSPTISPIQDVHQHPLVYGVLMDAIHGFRMPLFFLVSGFFTTMMWRKRGAAGLIQHRAIRIGGPLLLGMFTIIPALWVVMITGSTSIWSAVSEGDSHYVRRYIDSGGELDLHLTGQVLGEGATPLHLAVSQSHVEVVDMLLEAGADVDAVTRKVVGTQARLSTPLHWAAEAGQTQLTANLIQAGADVNRVDANGNTPLDFAREESNEELVILLSDAGAVSGEALPSDAVARAEAAVDDVRPADHDYLTEWILQSSGLAQVGALLVFAPLFMHLWFLYYLLWLVAGFVVVAGLGRALRLRGPPDWLLRRPVVWFWIVPLTLLPQLLMGQTCGPDTATGLVPWPPTLAYYAIFFGFGAVCYGRPEVEQQWSAGWIRCFIVAIVILPFGIMAIRWRGYDFTQYHVIASVVAACYAWLMVFGSIGLFLRFFASENDRVRYLSDSAYWLYLMHLPVVMWMQSWVATWALPSVLKLTLICFLTTVVLLVTYEAFVRYTPIGTLLNGKKSRRKRTSPEQTPASQVA